MGSAADVHKEIFDSMLNLSEMLRLIDVDDADSERDDADQMSVATQLHT